MVSTTPTAGVVGVAEIQDRLRRADDRFVVYDPMQGSVTVHFGPLAALVAEIVAEHTAVLRAERDEAERESRLRENEIVSLLGEVDRLQNRALDEIAENADADFAVRIIDRLTGGA